MKRQLAVLSFCFAFLAVAAFAHGDMQHVMGTVTKVTDSSITVKTTKGALVTVTVAPETKFMKDKAEAKVSDVTVGTRVAIEAKKDEKDATRLVAHMVMIGQMSGMSHHSQHN